MDINTFCTLALDALSFSETREQSDMTLSNFVQQSPIQFALLSYQLICEGANQKIQDVGATLLYHVIKVGICQSPEFMNVFWGIFSQHFKDILTKPTTSETTKSLLSNTIATMASTTFKLNGVSIIQEFIMELSDIPELETVILLVVQKILLEGSGLSGFPHNYLLQLVSKTLQYDSSVIPRAQLFFALSGSTEDNAFFVSVFPQLLTQFPQDKLQQLLVVIEGFAEKHAILFNDILESFVGFLVSIALCQTCEYRNMALFIFAALSIGAPLMCSNSPAFYQNVFPCLISIISEIDEQSIIIHDHNDTSSPAVAIDTFNLIFQSSGAPQYFIFLNQYRKEFLNQQREYNWKQLYALLFPFTIASGLIYQVFLENDDLMIDFTRDLIGFLQPNINNPYIKIVTYKIISRMSIHLYIHFPIKTSETLLPCLLSFLNEPQLEVQKAAVEALCNFLVGFNYRLKDYFNAVYPHIIDLIPKVAPEIQAYLFEIVARFENAVRENFIPYFPTVYSLVKQFYPTSQTYSHRISIIQAFAEGLYNILHKNKTVPQDCSPLIHTFLNDVIQMKDRYINEVFDQSCHNAMLKLIRLLGSDITNYADNLLKNSIETAQLDLSPEVFEEFEDTSCCPLSIYSKISPNGKPLKVFVLKTKIIEIHNAIEIINVIVILLRKKLTPYLNVFIGIIQKWIDYPYMSFTIINKIIKLFDNLLKYFSDEQEIMDQLLPFGFLMYFHILQYLDDIIKNNELITILLNHCRVLLSTSSKLGRVNLETFENTFRSFPQILHKIVESKAKRIKDLDKFNTQEQELDIKVNQTDSCLGTLFEVVRIAMKNFPQIFLPLYEEIFLPQIEQIITNPLTKSTGLSLLATYILVVGNDMSRINIINNFFQQLISSVMMKSLDVSISALNQLIEIEEKKFPLSNDLIQVLYNTYLSIMRDDNLVNYKMIAEIPDVAFAAFTLLVKNYLMHTPIRDQAIDEFFESFPVWEENPFSDIVFSFLADLLESNDPKILGNPDYIFTAIKEVASAIGNFMMESKTEERLVETMKSISVRSRDLFEECAKEVSPERMNKLLQYMGLVQ
ncbi:putative importin-beta 3 [Histomonas meleagridis]|uniref:putative importin-beta 3 n=1 Tax=Histomonas meleagridis TaxID=135588 RepID=UPI00355A4D0A|nr:putative importin-beta 3 [Histomonas meleagridis]KAH0801697.1 putative importin-beta 3 [Histomonas meleagridis]